MSTASVFSISLSAARGCREQIKARQKCYDHEGKGVNTEACYEEELNEKRCLAFHCCPLEAKRFYGSPGTKHEGKGECALWAEHFAFGNSKDEMNARIHTESREIVNRSEEKSRRCRKVLMDLSICMSHYSEMLLKVENRESLRQKQSGVPSATANTSR